MQVVLGIRRPPGGRVPPAAARVTVVLALVGALYAMALAPSSSARAPLRGRSVVVTRLSGTVMVKVRGGSRFGVLRGSQAIPVGSTIDASTGTVRLTAA